MNHTATAVGAGVNLGDLDFLIRGQVTADVADRLGVPIGEAEEFIRGSVSFAMTRRLGLNAVAAPDELAQAAGKQGVIGILIGLLLAAGEEDGDPEEVASVAPPHAGWCRA